MLARRLVFHLALRQAAGFAASVLRLLGLGLPVPDQRVLEQAEKSAMAGREGRFDVEALRAEMRELRAELENAKSEILAHFAARREAEDERDAWRRKFERLRRSAGAQ